MAGILQPRMNRITLVNSLIPRAEEKWVTSRVEPAPRNQASGQGTMGYLDELRRQAEAKRTAEMNSAAQRARLEEVYRSQVLPALQRLFKFLYEVSEHLNYLKPDVEVNYHVRGCGNLGFRPVEYIIGKPDEKRHNFFLRIIYSSGQKPRVDCLTKQDAEAEQEFLWRHNIPYEYDQRNDAKQQFLRGIFELSGEVYAELAFQAELESSAIKVKVKNFQVLGRQEYMLRPEEVNEQFLDQLAKYLTHSSQTPDFIKQYEAANFWAQKEKSPEQLMREKILAEVRQKQEEEKQRQREERLRQQAAAKKTVRQAGSAPDETSPPKKKGLFGLFDKG
jgi:hypothetical protein